MADSAQESPVPPTPNPQNTSADPPDPSSAHASVEASSGPSQSDRQEAGARSTDDSERALDPDTGRRLRTEVERGLKRLTASLGDQSPVASSVLGNVWQTVSIGVSAQRSVHVRQLHREQLEKLRTTLVYPRCIDRPDPLSELTSLIRRTPICLLTGPAGSGRTAVATHALDAILAPEQKLLLFRPTAEPDDLHLVRLETGHGYVIEIDEALARRPVAEVLADIDSLAAHRNIRVVVVADLPEPPTEWHDRHLLIRTPDREVVFQELLTRVHGLGKMTDAATLAATLGDASMADIAQSAVNVKRAVDEGLPPDTYLRDHLRRQVAEKFDDSSVPPLQAEGYEADRVRYERTFRRCCMLTAAVFDGRDVHEIIFRAKELTYLISGEEQPQLPVTLFGSPLVPLLNWLGADLQADGPAATPGLLTFRNPAIPDVVLEHVWRTHHLAGEAVLLWLDDLARNRRDRPPRPEVIRLQASQVIGRLASYDVRRIIVKLEEWIKSNTVSGLEATSWAVQMMVADESIEAEVWSQVQQWSRRGLLWRRAALVVYAQSGRRQQARQALLLAAEMAQQPSATDYLVAMVVRRVGQTDAPEAVLDLLTEWHAQIVRGRQLALRIRPGQIRLVSGLPTNAARTLLLLSEPEPLGCRTALVRRFVDSTTYASAICSLWRIALEDPAVTARAAGVLETWLRDGETDPDLTEAGNQLLRELSRMPDIRHRLHFHARRWITTFDESFPRSADVLRRHLHV